jgi:hypothetical protein
VVKHATRQLYVKKPRLVSSFERLLSDELGGKLEIELREEQGALREEPSAVPKPLAGEGSAVGVGSPPH